MFASSSNATVISTSDDHCCIELQQQDEVGDNDKNQNHPRIVWSLSSPISAVESKDASLISSTGSSLSSSSSSIITSVSSTTTSAKFPTTTVYSSNSINTTPPLSITTPRAIVKEQLSRCLREAMINEQQTSQHGTSSRQGEAKARTSQMEGIIDFGIDFFPCSGNGIGKRYGTLPTPTNAVETCPTTTGTDNHKHPRGAFFAAIPTFNRENVPLLNSSSVVPMSVTEEDEIGIEYNEEMTLRQDYKLERV